MLSQVGRARGDAQVYFGDDHAGGAGGDGASWTIRCSPGRHCVVSSLHPLVISSAAATSPVTTTAPTTNRALGERPGAPHVERLYQVCNGRINAPC
jgi:hypothetical protein